MSLWIIIPLAILVGVPSLIIGWLFCGFRELRRRG